MTPSFSPGRIYSMFVMIGLSLAVVAGCNTSMSSLFGGNASSDSSGGGAGANGAPAGSPVPQAPGTDSAAASPAAQIVRDIEEADIVKQTADKIYVLNPFKGLIIVDVSNPDHPSVLGSLDLRGRGVEMYIVGTQAFVVLSADFGYYTGGGGDPGAPRPAGASDVAATPAPPQPDFTGSQLAIVDVSNPATPTTLGKINLVGYAEQSRRVGSVIYIAGHNLASWEAASNTSSAQSSDPATPPPPGDGSGDYYAQERGFVASINIADPANIQPVQRKTFVGGSVNIHVSTTAIFAATDQYNSDTGDIYTRVQYVDITDPAGSIALRGSVNVPGSISSRFFMDAFNDTFRICTDNFGFGYETDRLFTYSIANPDSIAPLGSVEIIRGETLQAVRFDGPRAYAVTFHRVDPLFVIDVSDPAHPSVSGHLVVPGYSTYIQPRGDRLIAIGEDDTNGFRPAVAYYDVSNPAAPAELGRIILGPPNSYTDSQAVYDEKAFKIIDSLGMIVIPFNHVEYTDQGGGGGRPVPPVPATGGAGAGSSGAAGSGQTMPPTDSGVLCVNGVQIVDFSDTALHQRGWFDARSRVSRVGQVGSRVFAISDIALETINIGDRDHPAKAGEVLFIPEADLPNYDGCGYYYPYPIDYPVDTVVNPTDPAGMISAFLNALSSSGFCGAGPVLPGALMIVGLVGMRRGRRVRRK